MAKPKIIPKLDPKSELEAKVDAMMSTEQSATKPVAVPVPDSSAIDIFANEPKVSDEPLAAEPAPTTAPKLPSTKAAVSAESEPQPEPVSSLVASRPTSFKPAQPVSVADLNIDTAQSDAAIDDIVAQEADEVLAAQDAGIEAAVEAADEAVPAIKPRRGHPIFWFIVTVLVCVAVAAGYLLTHPDVNLPFSS